MRTSPWRPRRTGARPACRRPATGRCWPPRRSLGRAPRPRRLPGRPGRGRRSSPPPVARACPHAKDDQTPAHGFDQRRRVSVVRRHGEDSTTTRSSPEKRTAPRHDPSRRPRRRRRTRPRRRTDRRVDRGPAWDDNSGGMPDTVQAPAAQSRPGRPACGELAHPVPRAAGGAGQGQGPGYRTLRPDRHFDAGVTAANRTLSASRCRTVAASRGPTGAGFSIANAPPTRNRYRSRTRCVRQAARGWWLDRKCRRET